MSWISISADDLRDAKVAALVDALRTAALGNGQSDPSDGVIQTVVDRVRRKIASHPGNLLDADETTVPPSLKDLTMGLSLFALKNRLEIPLTDDERDQRRDFLRDLDRIADGTDTIEQPDNPITPAVERVGAEVEIIRAPAQVTGRERTSGL